MAYKELAVAAQSVNLL